MASSALINVRELRDTTKLTHAELAALFGVTRQTIHDWQDGRSAGKHTAARAIFVASALETAVRRGVLPLRPLSKHTRAARVRQMVLTLSNTPVPPPVNL